MPSKTFVNQRGVTHQQSSGVSTVFPDVCKTPTPGGIVPIPYPNVGHSKNTAKGPKSVTVDGYMPMVKSAKYPVSTGDEPGKAGGVISSTHKNECEFMTYSFDVKFEGRNVCRMGDTMFHNRKNIVG